MALPDGESAFGDGAAWLTGVALLDETGQPLAAVQGGEWVCLRLEAMARQTLVSPIFGFYLKDRLGQVLFGENTCHDLANVGRTVPAGTVLRAEFRFRMPSLRIHDALAVQSHSRVLHGLMALPTEMSLSIESVTDCEA
jgi:lipopolysaccharide transport system ATP-binding protein